VTETKRRFSNEYCQEPAENLRKSIDSKSGSSQKQIRQGLLKRHFFY